MPNSFDDGANDDPKAVEFLDARTTLNSSEVNLNADEQASHLHLHIVAPTTVVENEDTEDDSEEDLSDHDSERSPTPDFPSPLAADRTANGHLLKCRPNTPVVRRPPPKLQDDVADEAAGHARHEDDRVGCGKSLGEPGEAGAGFHDEAASTPTKPSLLTEFATQGAGQQTSGALGQPVVRGEEDQCQRERDAGACAEDEEGDGDELEFHDAEVDDELDDDLEEDAAMDEDDPESAYAAGVWGVSSAGGWPADCGAGHAEVWQGLRDENLVHMACSGYEHDDDQDDDDQAYAHAGAALGGLWDMLSMPSAMETDHDVELGGWREVGVDASYTGPRAPDETIDAPFVLKMLHHFRAQCTIHARYAWQIVDTAMEMFKTEETLVSVEVPLDRHITVCGDVHGQFYDLLNIFEVNGVPAEDNPYVFNGDFVDRGSFSVEVVLTLLAFKCAAPESMIMIRGNHESQMMNMMYGFHAEAVAKYGQDLAVRFRHLFCHLPLGACLNHKVLVMHGGLFSHDDVTLADINAVDRVREPPDDGLMAELLWSDPMPEAGRAPNVRGIGVSFGPDVTRTFLQKNGLSLLVRSHEVKANGFEVQHDGQLVTIFSAPNYCDRMDNKGAFIRFGADMIPHFTTFEAVAHPQVASYVHPGMFY